MPIRFPEIMRGLAGALSFPDNTSDHGLAHRFHEFLLAAGQRSPGSQSLYYWLSGRRRPRPGSIQLLFETLTVAAGSNESARRAISAAWPLLEDDAGRAPSERPPRSGQWTAGRAALLLALRGERVRLKRVGRATRPVLITSNGDLTLPLVARHGSAAGSSVWLTVGSLPALEADTSDVLDAHASFHAEALRYARARAPIAVEQGQALLLVDDTLESASHLLHQLCRHSIASFRNGGDPWPVLVDLRELPPDGAPLLRWPLTQPCPDWASLLAIHQLGALSFFCLGPRAGAPLDGFLHQLAGSHSPLVITTSSGEAEAVRLAMTAAGREPKTHEVRALPDELMLFSLRALAHAGSGATRAVGDDISLKADEYVELFDRRPKASSWLRALRSDELGWRPTELKGLPRGGVGLEPERPFACWIAANELPEGEAVDFVFLGERHQRGESSFARSLSTSLAGVGVEGARLGHAGADRSALLGLLVSAFEQVHVVRIRRAPEESSESEDDDAWNRALQLMRERGRPNFEEVCLMARRALVGRERAEDLSALRWRAVLPTAIQNAGRTLSEGEKADLDATIALLTEQHPDDEGLLTRALATRGHGALKEGRDLDAIADIEAAIQANVRSDDEAASQRTSQRVLLAATHRRLGSIDLADHVIREAQDQLVDIAMAPPGLAAQVSFHAGNIAKDAGDLDRALEQYRSGRSEFQALEGQDNWLASIANNMATIHVQLREHSEAVSEAELALKLWAEIPGSQVASIAGCHVNLGDAHLQARSLETAESEFRMALELYETLDPKPVEAYATAWYGLGRTLFLADRRELAEEGLTRALELREGQLGPDHWRVAWSHHWLGRLFSSLGQPARAMERLLRAASLERRAVADLAAALPERLARLRADDGPDSLDRAVAILGSMSSPPSDLVSSVFDELVRSRGLLADQLARRHALFLDCSRRGSVLADGLHDAWRGLATRLNVGPRPGEARADHLQELGRLRKKVEGLERQSGRLATGASPWVDDGGSPIRAIQRALGGGEVLLSFWRLGSDADGEGGRERYFAFILTREGEPQIRDLGPAEPIEEAVLRWQEGMRAGLTDQEKRLAAAASDCRAACESLAQLLLEPLKDHIARADRLLLVPDGELQLFSWATLAEVTAGSEHDIAEKVVQYLSTERDLLARQQSTGRGLLLVGDVDFHVELADEREASTRPPDPAELAVRSAETDELFFVDLGATRGELDAIGPLWQRLTGEPPTSLERELATEDAVVEQGPGHRVIHLATHAYVLGERAAPKVDSRRSAAPSDATQLASMTPLLRCGIALAGANLRHGASSMERDGLLTGAEIASIDLRGVDVVVLSACMGAAGSVRSGEGVYGLRRGFQLAGARCVVASPCRVHDRATKDWMASFYRELLNGRDAATSAHVASMERRAKEPHPARWGAFMVVGTTGSLVEEG